jgi:hypothetical protein
MHVRSKETKPLPLIHTVNISKYRSNRTDICTITNNNMLFSAVK